MDTFTLKLIDKSGAILSERTNENAVYLYAIREYENGDQIVLNVPKSNSFYVVQTDDALGEALIYLVGDEYHYHIPAKDKRDNYSPKAFFGNKHLVTARYATQEEIFNYRNLSVNVLDQHENSYSYPHASANVETRGEAVFAARNAIDGIKASHSHGDWPYESWGINRRADATWKVDFGRMVTIDKIIIYERTDFPHDNWWKQVTLTFSDQSTVVCDLSKTDQGQVVSIKKTGITWVQLEQLIPSDEPSPFPALTQLEVYGTEQNREEA